MDQSPHAGANVNSQLALRTRALPRVAAPQIHRLHPAAQHGSSHQEHLVPLVHVMHRYRTDMVIAGSYSIMMGVLILFWNLLSLLMHLGDR